MKPFIDTLNAIRYGNLHEELTDKLSELTKACAETGKVGELEARLRYRIDEGRLAFWYDLLRPHKVLENAVMDVWKEISDQTKQEIFHGDAMA